MSNIKIRNKEPTQVDLIIDDLKELMENLGTYNASFDLTIKYLATLILEYNKAEEQFEKTGGNVVVFYTNKSGATNLIKNPLYQAIEGMRKDILSYLRELGLTPSGLKKIKTRSFENVAEEDSPLVEILRKLV